MLSVATCSPLITALAVLSENPDKVIEIKAENYDNACDIEAKLKDPTWTGLTLDEHRPIASTVTGKQTCEFQKDCTWIHKGRGKGCCVEVEFNYREKTKTWEVPKKKYCWDIVDEDDGAEADENDERDDSLGNILGRPLLPLKNEDVVWVEMTSTNEDFCFIEQDVNDPIISQRKRVILNKKTDEKQIEECQNFEGCRFQSLDGGKTGCCADKTLTRTPLESGKPAAQIPKQLSCPFVEHANSETVKSVHRPKEFVETNIVAPTWTTMCNIEEHYEPDPWDKGSVRDISRRKHTKVETAKNKQILKEVCEKESCLWQEYEDGGCCIDPDFKMIHKEEYYDESDDNKIKEKIVRDNYSRKSYKRRYKIPKEERCTDRELKIE